MRSRKEMAQTFPITFLILLNVVFWSYPANGRILHYTHYNTALNNASLKTCQHTYRNLTAQELARCKYVSLLKPAAHEREQLAELTASRGS
jgi:hypothetical protein